MWNQYSIWGKMSCLEIHNSLVGCWTALICRRCTIELHCTYRSNSKYKQCAVAICSALYHFACREENFIHWIHPPAIIDSYKSLRHALTNHFSNFVSLLFTMATPQCSSVIVLYARHHYGARLMLCLYATRLFAFLLIIFLEKNRA